MSQLQGRLRVAHAAAELAETQPALPAYVQGSRLQYIVLSAITWLHFQQQAGSSCLSRTLGLRTQRAINPLLTLDTSLLVSIGLISYTS